jgi:hypothetical protein
LCTAVKAQEVGHHSDDRLHEPGGVIVARRRSGHGRASTPGCGRC